MLPDSGHIQEMEVERKNRKIQRCGGKLLTPIYTALEAEECVNISERLITIKNFLRQKELMSPCGCRTYFRICHGGNQVLGRVRTENCFTGDFGRNNRPIINDPTIIKEADFLVMESTYGNRFHEDIVDNKITLTEIINETFQRGGNVIIPAFAVDRTQDLLYLE